MSGRKYQSVVIAVLSAERKRTHELDLALALQLPFEQPQQEPASLLTGERDRFAPPIGVEQGGESRFLAVTTDKPVDMRQRQEEERLRARKVEETPRERH